MRRIEQSKDVPAKRDGEAWKEGKMINNQGFGTVQFRVNEQGKFEVAPSHRQRGGNVGVQGLVDDAQRLYDHFEDKLETMVELDNKPAPALPPKPETPSVWRPVQRWNHPKEIAKWEREVERLKASPVDSDDTLGIVSLKNGQELKYEPGQTGPGGGIAVSEMTFSRQSTELYDYGGDSVMVMGHSRVNRDLHGSVKSDGERSDYFVHLKSGWIIGEREMSINWKTREGTIKASTNAHSGD